MTRAQYDEITSTLAAIMAEVRDLGIRDDDLVKTYEIGVRHGQSMERKRLGVPEVESFTTSPERRLRVVKGDQS